MICPVNSNAVISVIFTIISLQLGYAQPTTRNAGWYKGNIHVHTKHSDGNTCLDSVINWYRNSHYDFLAVTDHNKLTFSDSIKQRYEIESTFLLIPGVEVSDRFGKHPVHVNGIGIGINVLPKGGNSISEVIDNDLQSVTDAGGIGIVNHPNGQLAYPLTSADLLSSKLATHFEVCCADYKGGSGKPSTDKIWDEVLSGGKIMYGMTSDDAHNFKAYSKDPGNAWIMVQAERLERHSILKAIKEGRFYSTTGVIVGEYTVSNAIIQVRLSKDGYGYKTFFIGPYGKILAVDESDNPTYLLKQPDKYVRCKIERSDGAIAWFQPLFWTLEMAR